MKKVKEETKVSDVNYSTDFMQKDEPYKTGIRYLDQQLADLGAEAEDHYSMDLAEENSHYIEINHPKQINSSKVINEVEKLAKKGIRSKDIKLQMAFVVSDKLQKEIFGKFQVLKNKIYFELNESDCSLEDEIKEAFKHNSNTPI